MARIAPAQASRQSGRVSYEEFLQRFRNGERYEWVDGEIVPMPPVSSSHNESSNLLLRWIGEWVEHHDLGAVRTDPLQMKPAPHLPGRAPDLLFVSKARIDSLRPTHLEGPADLVIEIISPSTRTIDRVEKFEEYESGGVGEYWLIDPGSKVAEFYRLGTDGRFQAVEPDPSRCYKSEGLRGFTLQVDWLWNPPKMSVVRAALGLP